MVEKSDNSWQRKLRAHQVWWREQHTDLPAGPLRRGSDRLVGSMLPEGVGLSTNLLTADARTAAHTAISELSGTQRPGLIQVDRLERNLLSSQPLCFNLFGHMSHHTEALLPWVRTFNAEASEISAVKLEWAPGSGTVTRSAFDAFVAYRIRDGRSGFLGIEVKYAEDLKAALRSPAPERVKVATGDAWRSGAVEALDANGLRQFWYNTLLAQAVLADFDEGFSVVVACEADTKAREATRRVADQLSDPGFLQFRSIESVVDSTDHQEEWARSFRERYLDFGHSGVM